MSSNIPLRDYLKLQTSKLASTNVQEVKIKSEAIQGCMLQTERLLTKGENQLSPD